MRLLRIASSDPLSTFHAQARVLGDVFVGEGICGSVEVLVTTGSVVNAQMVVRGEAETGFMASNWVARAVAGEDPFPEPVAVAVVAPLNAGPLFFVAPADAPFSTVAELKGRRVAVGHADSGMAQHARNMAEVLGWEDAGIEFVHRSTFDGGAALAEGVVDAQLSAPVPSVHFDELCRRLAVKVLAFSEDEIAALCSAVPFYSPASVPAEFVPGLAADMPALGVLNIIVAARDGNEALAHDMAAAWIRRAADVEDANPLFRGLGELMARARTAGREAIAPGGIPLHRGAEQAFREAGLLR